MIDAQGYRKNVGIILCNTNNELLICKRYKETSWQFPQGGFIKHETAEDAMYRELYEEVGLAKEDICILGKTKSWLRYNLPKKYQRKTNNKEKKNKKQIWFLLRLISNDGNINLNTSKKPEFDDWEWSHEDKPLEIVISFKKNVYKQALQQLLPIIKN